MPSIAASSPAASIPATPSPVMPSPAHALFGPARRVCHAQSRHALFGPARACYARSDRAPSGHGRVYAVLVPGSARQVVGPVEPGQQCFDVARFYGGASPDS